MHGPPQGKWSQSHKITRLSCSRLEFTQRRSEFQVMTQPRRGKNDKQRKHRWICNLILYKVRQHRVPSERSPHDKQCSPGSESRTQTVCVLLIPIHIRRIKLCPNPLRRHWLGLDSISSWPPLIIRSIAPFSRRRGRQGLKVATDYRATQDRQPSVRWRQTSNCVIVASHQQVNVPCRCVKGGKGEGQRFLTSRTSLSGRRAKIKHWSKSHKSRWGNGTAFLK